MCFINSCFYIHSSIPKYNIREIYKCCYESIPKIKKCVLTIEERTENCRLLLLPHNSQQILGYSPNLISGIYSFTIFITYQAQQGTVPPKKQRVPPEKLIKLCGIYNYIIFLSNMQYIPNIFLIFYNNYLSHAN